MTVAGRRKLWRIAAVALVAAVGLVVALVPLPFLELAPGPTYNVVGEVQGKPLLEITGATTYPTDGHLQMTTVSERGGPDNGVLTVRVLTGWLDPAVRVLPREAFYSDDQSGSDVSAETARQFSDSKATAVAAAARHLGKPVTEVTIVESVINGSPADTHLEPGDEIVSVNGPPVSKPEDVATAMSSVKPGAVVTVVVRRGDDRALRTEQVGTTTNPRDPSRAFMGISIGTTYRTTFDVDVTLDGVGGPSAGLFLSLGVVDLLTPGALPAGRFIAGTGTMDADGAVGPIGGIGQKLRGARSAGATLFLVPADNCSEALASGVPDGLTLARVATLDDAISAIENYTAGKQLTGCS